MGEHKTVGFIGLGAMGGALAANVLKGSFPLIVHDLNPKAAEPLLADGARWAESPAALARESDVVLLSLPMPADVEAVCTGENGVFAGVRPGSVCFDMSTNSLATLRRLHGLAAAHGLAFLDAPVSGGAAGAAAGRLVIWVGGDNAVFEAHRDVLGTMGDRVQHMGDLGAATVAKLAINMTASGIGCLLSEAMTLAVKGGLDPLDFWQALRASALGRRNTFDSLGDRFLTGDVENPAFALRLAHKDVTLASEMARTLGVPMRMADLALAEMTEAMARGWGERDVWSAMMLQPERAGVDVTVSSERLKAMFDAS
jgi:3-hydroxyisobutyrate dehydrogenase